MERARAAVGGGVPARWVGGTALVAAAAVAALLAATRWGIGTSPDSVHYVRAARLVAEAGTSAAAEPLTHFAPLYPLLLALGIRLDIFVLEWARIVNAVCLGLTVFATGMLVARSVRHAPWLGVVGAVLLAASVPALGVYTTALSEPVFLLLTIAGFALLARHLEAPSIPLLVAGAAVLGLAVFTRYAGAACVLTGGLALLVLGRQPLGTRVRDALLFGGVSAAPLLAWKLLHVSAAAGPARELAFHPVGRGHAWQAIYTTSAWLLVPQAAPNVVRLAVLGLAAVAVLLAAVARWRRGEAAPRIVAVCALFVGVYAAFLVLSLSFFDANTPLDDRILLPAFVAALVVGLDLCGEAVASRRRAAVVIVLGALLVVTTGQLVASARMAARGFDRGWGFSSRAWQESPTLARVGALPAGTVAYSNAPEIVYLHTGQAPRALPRRTRLVTRQPNEAFDRELAEVGRDLRERCGVVAYFRGVTDDSSIVAARSLQDRLALRVRWSGTDGSLLEVPECAR
jgi:hypothetical protein